MSASAAAAPPGRPRRLVRVVGPPLLGAAALLGAWALAEAGFTLLLSRPALLRHAPPNLARHLRGYYLEHDRDLLQANPRASRYDPELFYTLRPGRFRHAGREFDVAFEVNSLGVRGSAAALDAPEAVVAGDSFAMGWGVEADEAFPRLLQAHTGLRTLNAGVSSYGTARELLLLRRVDTRRLRLLVIQYSQNDAWENFALERHAGRLPIRPRGRYESTLLGSREKRRYWPGRHTFEILRGAVAPRAASEEGPLPAPPEQARLFTYVLRTLLPAAWPAATGGAPPDGSGIVVFELAPAAPSDGAFARLLRAELQAAGQPEWLRRVEVLDMHRLLRAEHYFDLDDHLRPGGHRVLAEELARAAVRLGAVGATR